MPDEEVQKAICKAYVEEFKKQNPNMIVIGAYYHADEMRDDGNGGFIKGALHLHLDYIPVAYKCKRGQRVQNSMNGALIEQGIVNIEIEPETALKVFGKRDKSKREKKESTLQNSPQNMTRKIKCFPKIEKKKRSKKRNLKKPV